MRHFAKSLFLLNLDPILGTVGRRRLSNEGKSVIWTFSRTFTAVSQWRVLFPSPLIEFQMHFRIQALDEEDKTSVSFKPVSHAVYFHPVVLKGGNALIAKFILLFFANSLSKPFTRPRPFRGIPKSSDILVALSHFSCHHWPSQKVVGGFKVDPSLLTRLWPSVAFVCGFLCSRDGNSWN